MPPIQGILSNLWRFHDALHPVYSRPPSDVAWPVPTVGTLAQDYQEEPLTDVVGENLRLDVLGHPSAAIYQELGSSDTVVAIQRRTRFMETLDPSDEARIEQIAQRMYEFCMNLSQGPYTPSDLSDMGHPYGWTSSWSKGDLTHAGRLVPRRWGGKSLGHRKGVRGSVPTKSVVNVGTGAFSAAWSWDVEWTDTGFKIEVRNSRAGSRGEPISWFLAHGTIYMQPHGPWRYVLDRFMGELRRTWSSITIQAAMRHRSLAAAVGDEMAEEMIA